MKRPAALDGPRIVIIGGGFSGAAPAIELMRGVYVVRSLHATEAAGEIGRGLAYGTDSALHLLNPRAVMMSVTGDHRRGSMRLGR